MDASKAMKAAKTAKPADPASLPPLQEHKTSGLRGRVEGLDFSARQAILESEDRVAIAYGSLGSPLILQEKVNVALLRHYIPKIVEDCYATSTKSDDMIVLPDNMWLVTERGLKHVIRCMRQEMQHGSYSCNNSHGEQSGRCMIRPHLNVVDSIHAMNTLRAFGLDHDAEILGRKGGPIAVGLKIRAQKWTEGLGGLGRFLEKMDRDLLEGQEKELLSEAWAVYNDRRYGSSKPSIALQSSA